MDSCLEKLNKWVIKHEKLLYNTRNPVIKLPMSNLVILYKDLSQHENPILRSMSFENPLVLQHFGMTFKIKGI